MRVFVNREEIIRIVSAYLREHKEIAVKADTAVNVTERTYEGEHDFAGLQFDLD